MFPMYVNGERVMILRYKPDIGDVIKDDDTGKWYRVLKIAERKVQARRTMGLDY